MNFVKHYHVRPLRPRIAPINPSTPSRPPTTVNEAVEGFKRNALLVSVMLASIVQSIGAQKLSGPYRPDVLGTFTLPTVDKSTLPTVCNDFAAACDAEKEKDYETAIKLYEEKYKTCGDHGWRVIGHGKGSNDFVVFKVTPCGLRVAIKASRSGKECTALKVLTNGDAYDACRGCFPRFYFQSNFTNACYTEHVRSLPFVGFDALVPQERDLFAVKDAFLQVVHIVRVLISANIQHLDLSFRNIMPKLMRTSTGEKRTRIVLFDFGASAPLVEAGLSRQNSEHDTLQHPRLRKARKLGGNSGHSDIYAACCMFLDRVYAEAECWAGVPSLPLVVNPRSFKHALIAILAEHDSPSARTQPKFRWIWKTVKAVTEF